MIAIEPTMYRRTQIDGSPGPSPRCERSIRRLCKSSCFVSSAIIFFTIPISSKFALLSAQSRQNVLPGGMPRWSKPANKSHDQSKGDRIQSHLPRDLYAKYHFAKGDGI